jgi:hypothetical protein
MGVTNRVSEQIAPDRPTPIGPGASGPAPLEAAHAPRSSGPASGHAGSAPTPPPSSRDLDAWVDESSAGDTEALALDLLHTYDRAGTDHRAGFALGTGLLYEAPGLALSGAILQRVSSTFKQSFAPWRLRRDQWGPTTALSRFVIESAERFSSLEEVEAPANLLELFRELQAAPEYGVALFRAWVLLELQDGREPWPGCSLRKPPKRPRGRPPNDGVDWLPEARRLLDEGVPLDRLLKGRQLDDLEAFLSGASDAEIAKRWNIRGSGVRKRRERLRRKVSQIAPTYR